MRPFDPPGDGARELADSILGYVDSDDAPDSTRADALAIAFVDIAERVFPGGLRGGGTTGVDFDRDGVAVRVVAMQVPPEPAPSAWVPWPTSEGFWWQRLRRVPSARFLIRACRREGQPSLVVEGHGTDHVDIRSALTEAALEFCPARIEEPPGGE